MFKEPQISCSNCYSTNFRLSRVRPEDRLNVWLLRYPVRCKDCGTRTYASRFFANYLRKKGGNARKDAIEAERV